MIVNKHTDFQNQNQKVKQLPKLIKVNFILKCFSDTEGDISFNSTMLGNFLEEVLDLKK